MQIEKQKVRAQQTGSNRSIVSHKSGTKFNQLDLSNRKFHDLINSLAPRSLSAPGLLIWTCPVEGKVIMGIQPAKNELNHQNRKILGLSRKWSGMNCGYQQKLWFFDSLRYEPGLLGQIGGNTFHGGSPLIWPWFFSDHQIISDQSQVRLTHPKWKVGITIPPSGNIQDVARHQNLDHPQSSTGSANFGLVF